MESSRIYKWLGLDIHRLNRSSYIYSHFGSIIIFGIIGLLLEVLFVEIFNTTVGVIVIYLIILSWYVYDISLGVRRLHDFNANGWYVLFAFVPIANLVLSVTLLFKGGDNDANNYGNPLTRSYLMGFGVTKQLL